VQELAKEFPPGTRIILHGARWHLMGYTERDGLIITSTDPIEDYDVAVAARRTIHAQHVRDGEVGVERD